MRSIRNLLLCAGRVVGDEGLQPRLLFSLQMLSKYIVCFQFVFFFLVFFLIFLQLLHFFTCLIFLFSYIPKNPSRLFICAMSVFNPVGLTLSLHCNLDFFSLFTAVCHAELRPSLCLTAALGDTPY